MWYKKAKAKEKEITKHQFMKFFRDNDCLAELTIDERKELFKYSLAGSMDLTKELINDVLSDYGIDSIKVVDVDA